MNITLNQNLKNIKQFLELTYYEENASKEEVFNFLQDILKYVSNQNNLNLKNYDIQIHFVSSKVLGDAEAKIIPDEKYLNKFDILFNKKYQTYKCKNSEDSSQFFSFVYYAFHEFSHLIQFIKKPKETRLVTEQHDYLYNSINLFHKYMANSKEKRLILKSLTNHINSLEYIDSVEKDANKQAYNYFTSILQKLIATEHNEEFVDFLCSLYKFLDDIEVDNYNLYKKFGKINYENLLRLNKTNWKIELNKIINNLV